MIDKLYYWQWEHRRLQLRIDADNLASVLQTAEHAADGICRECEQSQFINICYELQPVSEIMSFTSNTVNYRLLALILDTKLTQILLPGPLAAIGRGGGHSS